MNITKDEIEEKLNTLDSNVLSFLDITGKLDSGSLEILSEYNKKYTELNQKFEETSKMLIAYSRKRVGLYWDRFDQLFDDFNYIYDSSSNKVNDILIESTKEIQQATQKSKGIDLAVFSLILTILAFVLTNAKILAASEIDFKNVLLVNLSFLLAAIVLFSFIYLFLGIIPYGRRGIAKILILIITPIFLIFGIVLIALLMH